jgi:ribosomal protein S18 acetylase RimI-like enzyme
MLLIRRIHLGEAELFRCIRLAALREAPRAFGSTYDSALRRTPESWREQADSTACGPDRATFLAFSDELPIGIVALYRLRRGSDTGELMQMWIAPEYRGRGIAKRMMDAAFQWAGNNQFRAIVVKVARNNARALKLYREYGFVPAKRALSNHPDDHVVLIKPIKSQGCI